MTEAGAQGVEREGDRAGGRWTIADLLTGSRVPLAIAFLLIPHAGWRFAILAVAAATDLLDGFLARRFGSSRLGAFLDPVADKLFMACAFAVVLLSGQLTWYEIIGVMARDLVATAAFITVTVRKRPAAIPARAGGKAVTVAQILTLLAFLAESSLLRPLAWATGAIAIYAIWDYTRVADTARKEL
jgi:cardiolipin synthase (CMP-forming)